MKLRFIREDAKTVTVENSLGWKIRVAKGGLRPAQLRNIQSFFKGEDVEPVWDPERGPQLSPSDPTDAQISNLGTTALETAADTGRALLYPPEARSKAARAWETGQRAGVFPTDDSAVGFLQGVGRGIQGLGHSVLPNTVSAPDAAPGPAPAVGVPPLLAKPGEDVPPPATAGEPVPAPANAATPRGSGGPDEMQQGEAQAIHGIQASAQAKADAAAAMVDAEQAKATKMAALSADFDSRMKAHQAKSDELFDGIMSEKIDPNRFWSSRSTGGKVAGVIGLILGSFGRGGENSAVKILQQSIDTDIDAQKADLGKKQTLLGHYMQQGRDMQSAEQMVRADALDASAAQLAIAAARSAGPEAKAAAQVQIGEFRMNAQKMRQEGTARDMQMQLERGQLEAQRAQIAQQTAQNSILNGLLGGGQSGGTRIDPRVIGMLPADIQSKLVSLPDGTFATARTKEDAEKVKASNAITAEFSDKLRRYRGILEANPHGVWNPMGEEYGAAKALRADLLTSIGHLSSEQGGNRLSPEQAREYEQMIGDITGPTAPGQAKARLDGLDANLAAKVMSVNNQYLNLPQMRRPGAK